MVQTMIVVLAEVYSCLFYCCVNHNLNITLHFTGVFGVEQPTLKTTSIPDEINAMLSNSASNGGGDSDHGE